MLAGLRATVLALLEEDSVHVSAGVLRGQATQLERARAEEHALSQKYKDAQLVIVQRSFCMDVTSYGNHLNGDVPSH